MTKAVMLSSTHGLLPGQPHTRVETVGSGVRAGDRKTGGRSSRHRLSLSEFEQGCLHIVVGNHCHRELLPWVIILGNFCGETLLLAACGEGERHVSTRLQEEAQRRKQRFSTTLPLSKSS
jgi:hypothetical protein